MSTVLEVRNLVKSYPSFRLKELSFSLQEGRIIGLIGRNGAGKTTTIHSLLGLLAPDSGEILYWGKPFSGQEAAVKERIGFVSAGMQYYGRKKLKTITEVTRSFYPHWDEEAYRRNLALFSLEEEKTPEKLSNGMKIKYMLALALSHGAELLILDEPTSGLDPVSREELLEIFLELRDRGKTILFSTHITSDLEKTADDILYIVGGERKAEASLEDFIGSYRLTELPEAGLPEELGHILIGRRRSRNGYTALLRTEDLPLLPIPARPASLEEIMAHLEKEAAEC